VQVAGGHMEDACKHHERGTDAPAARLWRMRVWVSDSWTYSVCE